MESGSRKKFAKLNITVSLHLPINVVAFIEDLLYCSLSFHLKSEIRKYREQSLSDRYTRYFTLKIICIQCNGNAYFMVAL